MRAAGGMRRYVLLWLPLCSLTLLAAGCSKGGTVSGKVYFRGQLVKAGTVYFVPEGQSGRFNAIIQPDGSYSIPKLPRGRAKIGVASGSNSVPASAFKGMGRGGKVAEKGLKQAERIGRAASGTEETGHDTEKAPKDVTIVPTKYADAEESGLTIDITGGDQPFDIRIEELK